MALRRLDVAYADTSANQLSLSLDAPATGLTRLDSLVLDAPAGPGTRLGLHLLGASHEAVLTTPGGESREVVACLPVPAPELPALVDRHAGGVDYRFSSEVRRPPADRFRAEVAALRERLAGDVHALVGVFPGDPDAVTGLLAEPGRGRVSWRTWHAYPGSHELVLTRTTAWVRPG